MALHERSRVQTKDHICLTPAGRELMHVYLLWLGLTNQEDVRMMLTQMIIINMTSFIHARRCAVCKCTCVAASVCVHVCIFMLVCACLHI